MIVADTHAWLWWVANDPLLSPNAAKELLEADVVGVSCISCWEIALLTSGGRLSLDRDPVVWMREALNAPRVILLELTPEVAMASARLPWQHRDPADRLIVATAIIHGARLITKDETIRAFAPARAVW